jgi:hypothetical protein
MESIRTITLAAAVALSPVLAGTAAAQSKSTPTAGDAWAWRGTLYGWFPNVNATANLGLPGGGQVAIDAGPDDYLSKLQFALMGTLEARKGPWSIFGDVVIFDFGNVSSNATSISGPGGPVPLPPGTALSTDFKGFVGEVAAGYSVLQTPTANLDIVGGVRYLRLKAGLDFTFGAVPPGVPPQGSVESSKDFWDGVVGVRGKADFADKWFASYYADVGTGSSSFTWQAFAGVGYRFKWVDALVGYRHLQYNFSSDRPVSDLRLSGPLLGVGLSF